MYPEPRPRDDWLIDKALIEQPKARLAQLPIPWSGSCGFVVLQTLHGEGSDR
jgi:hypothetical protein